MKYENLIKLRDRLAYLAEEATDDEWEELDNEWVDIKIGALAICFPLDRNTAKTLKTTIEIALKEYFI